ALVATLSVTIFSSKGFWFPCRSFFQKRNGCPGTSYILDNQKTNKIGHQCYSSGTSPRPADSVLRSRKRVSLSASCAAHYVGRFEKYVSHQDQRQHARHHSYDCKTWRV